MGDLWSDRDREAVSRPTAAEARAARRASMTPHERATEDLVDVYSQAVKDGAVLEFFQRVAADRVRLASFELQRAELGQERARLSAQRQALHELATEVMTRTNAAAFGD